MRLERLERLKRLETNLNRTYPRAFREIYETGALDWLWVGPQKKTHLFPNYLLEEKEFYPYWNLLESSKIEWAIRYLRKCVRMGGGRWKETVRALPFAWTDEGDIFFFNSALGPENSQVFQWNEYRGNAYLINEDLERFICSHLCEIVVNRGMGTDHWWIQNQLRWLTPEHREILLRGGGDERCDLYGDTITIEGADYIIYENQ